MPYALLIRPLHTKHAPHKTCTVTPSVVTNQVLHLTSTSGALTTNVHYHNRTAQHIQVYIHAPD